MLNSVVIRIGHSFTHKADLQGYACILTSGNHRKEIVGVRTAQSGNIVTLTAIYAALKLLRKPSNVTIISDLPYIYNTWARIPDYVTWGWKTKTGTNVKNAEAWKAILALAAKGGHNVQIRKASANDLDITLCNQQSALCVTRMAQTAVSRIR